MSDEATTEKEKFNPWACDLCGLDLEVLDRKARVKHRVACVQKVLQS